MAGTAFITHSDCWLHNMGAGHPESPDRLSAIRDRMIASGLEQYVESFDAPQATMEQLQRAHSPEYVRELFETAPERGIVHLDPDTVMCSHTLKAALRAAFGLGLLFTAFNAVIVMFLFLLRVKIYAATNRFVSVVSLVSYMVNSGEDLTATVSCE